MTLRTDLIKIAADLPEGDPTRRRILSALKEAGDVTVHSADVMGGEMDGAFNMLAEVEFTVQGRTLTRLLGAPLSDVTPQEAVRRLRGGGSGVAEVMRVVRPAVMRVLGDYKGEEPRDWLTSRIDVDLAGGGSCSAKIDARRQAVTYTVGLEVWGEWEGLD